MHKSNEKAILSSKPTSLPIYLDPTNSDISLCNTDETVNYKCNFLNPMEIKEKCPTYGNLHQVDNVDKTQLSLHENISVEIGILKCKLSKIEDIIINIEKTLLRCTWMYASILKCL